VKEEGRRKKEEGRSKEGRNLGIYLSLFFNCFVLVNFSTFEGRQKAKGRNLLSSCASTTAFLPTSRFQP
jgi:hypothetical protein